MDWGVVVITFARRKHRAIGSCQTARLDAVPCGFRASVRAVHTSILSKVRAPVSEKRKSSRLGAPPADWLTQSDVLLRGSSAETQKLPRIGGPPREFGDTASSRKRADGPLTALVVSEDRDSAARIAIALAGAQFSIRLALNLTDVEPLLEGTAVLFAVVTRGDSSIARSLRHWSDGRRVFALVPDRETADRVRGYCDAALERPWDIEGALATLR